MKLVPRYRGLSLTVILSGLVLFAAPLAEANMKLGTNLPAVNDWNSHPYWYNSMNHARGWLLKRDGATEWKSSDRSGKIPQRSNDGYPTQVPFWHNGNSWWVHTIIPVWENGQHKLQVTGSGQVKYRGPGLSWQTRNLNGGTSTFFLNFSGVDDISAKESGREIRVGTDSMFLEITQSNSGDPIRDIRVMRPGHHNAGKHEFDQDFKNYLSFYNTIRFMDWGETNNNVMTDWSERTPEDWYTQGNKHYGVAYEHMIDLANQLNKDLWICVPHKANNTFVNNMANLFNNRTENARHIYLEYSNEVWNGMFDQADWVENSGYAGSNRMNKYGTRAGQVFDRWSSRISNDGSRLTRVISGQSNNDWQTLQALETAASKTDAIAIAPYFGKSFRSVPNPLPSFDQLDDETYTEFADVENGISSHKQLAIDHGISKLLCYEGGQHYTAIFGATNDDGLTDRLVSFNRDWRMRNLYRYDYLDKVNDGVSLFCHFAGVGEKWNKDGSWPSMEYFGQSIGTGGNQAGKEWALRDWKNDNPDGSVDLGGGGGGGGGGSNPSVGDRIQAEDYVAQSGTQIGSGYYVGWIDQGDWMEYDVDVPSSGSYTATFRVASNFSGRSFQLRDGGSTLATVNVPDSSGGWQDWKTVTVNINLSAGTRTLRLYASMASWNIDWWEINTGSGGGGGGGGSGTGDRIEAEDYSTMSGIQTQNTSDSGGGENVGWIDNGDWMDYTVSVPSSGSYEVSFRVASPNSGARLALKSGSNTLATVNVPQTGNWQNWQTVTVNANLSGGSQTLRIESTANAGWNFNWWEFVAGSGGGGDDGDGGGGGDGGTSGIDSGSYYTLENKANGELLDTDGDAVDANHSNVRDDTKWKFVDRGNGYYTLENKANGELLDTDGDAVDANHSNVRDDTKWKPVDRGDGYHTLENKATGKLLDTDGYSVDANTTNVGDDTKWKLVKR